MPTYQYECAKCGESFEIFQSMKDAALRNCPKDKCARTPWGRGKVNRILGTGAGLLFKGSGFYITDYRSENYKAAAKNDKPAAEASAGGEAKKKSDAPASAAASKPAETRAKPAPPAKPAAS